MEKKHFYLGHNCIHEIGYCNSVIYDIDKRGVYFVDKEGTECLKLSERGVPLEQIGKGRPDLCNVFEFYDEIEKQGLGSYYTNNIFIENAKTLADLKRTDLQRITKDIEIITLVIEINQVCGLRCKHCARKGGVDLCGCSIRDNYPMKDAFIKYDRLERALAEISKFAPHEVMLIGGDPLVSYRSLKKIIDILNILGVNRITIYSNATNLNREILSLISKYGARLIVPIYASNVTEHDKITRVGGSFQRTLYNIKKLIDRRIEVVPIIYSSSNETGSVERSLKETGCSHIKHGHYYKTVLGRPVGVRSNYKFYVPDRGTNIDIEAYIRSKTTNTCLYGRLAILTGGDLLPCQNARAYKIGNIYEGTSIDEVLKRGLLDKYWYMSREKIETCKDCEQRLHCQDCLIFGHKIVDDRCGANSFCSYSPYSGMPDKVKQSRK